MTHTLIQLVKLKKLTSFKKSIISKIYDDFYVNIYDDLFFKELTNQYEVGSIQNITNPTTESNMLIIGSGTGHVANELYTQGHPLNDKDSETTTNLHQVQQ